MSAEERAAQADTVQTVSRWNQLEPAPYARLYSEDMQFYLRGARFARSRSGFEKKIQGLMAAYESYTIEPSDPQIRALGPDAAVASFTYTGQAVDTAGSSQNVQPAITLLYERREGDWTNSLAHESVVPPEQSA